MTINWFISAATTKDCFFLKKLRAKFSKKTKTNKIGEAAGHLTVFNEKKTAPPVFILAVNHDYHKKRLMQTNLGAN